MERLSNLPKVTQLLRGGAGIHRHKVSHTLWHSKSEVLNELSWKPNGDFLCLIVEESFVSWINWDFTFLPCKFSKVSALTYLQNYFFLQPPMLRTHLGESICCLIFLNSIFDFILLDTRCHFYFDWIQMKEHWSFLALQCGDSVIQVNLRESILKPSAGVEAEQN